MNQDPTILALQQRLDTIHIDLTQGKLENLAAHADDIELLLPQIEALPEGPAALRLRDAAQRNADCLIAAREGLLAARRRLADVFAAAQGLSTYDVVGQRTVLAQPTAHLARRI